MREPGLCEILAQADDDTLTSLLSLVPEDVELVRHPLEGLLLMTCRDGLGERFHLGEVLVAECQVLYRQTVGHAMVIGGDERQALAAAVVDALRTHPDPHPDLPRIESLVARAREGIVATRTLEAQLSGSTRVEFDLMPGA
jgi:phosphonate C-P lyase system protein PhnG